MCWPNVCLKASNSWLPSLIVFALLTSMRHHAGGAESAGRKIPRLSLFEFSTPAEDRDKRPGRSYLALTGEFHAPGGKTDRVSGFLFQDYRLENLDGTKTLVPSKPLQWRLRYVPRKTGHYTYRITRQDDVLEEGVFECVPSEARGYIGLAGDKRYFRYDNGDFYFALGHNVCWSGGDLLCRQFEKYFSRMAEAGENYARVWLCSWDLALQGDRPGAIRLQQAWRLDRVFALAQKHHIQLKVCLDNFHDYKARDKIAQNAYFRVNGGPCEDMEDFFSKEQAKTIYRGKIDYLVARFAHYPNLFAWELWNEMNYVLSYGRDSKRAMVDWNAEMALRFRSRDIYRHLITTSLGLDTLWPELWQDENMDLVQMHSYLPSRPPTRNMQAYPEDLLDAALFLMVRKAPMAMLKKPVLFAEFGFQGTNEDHPMNAMDKDGIHLHNGIWASLFSGYAGCAMMWWWDGYLEPNDLYGHYRAMHRYLQGEDLAMQQARPLYLSNGRIRAMVLRGTSRALIWVHNLESTWYQRLVRGVKPRLREQEGFLLPGMPGGRYRVEWWDTYTGTVIARKIVQSATGKLAIQIPAFDLDMAAKAYMLP